MKTAHAIWKLVSIGALVSVVAVAGTSVSAQTTSATAAKPVLPSPTAPVKKPAPTSATPAMILEAIQRSQARSDKLRASGRAEQFGSEEPFIFDPGK